MIRHGTRPVKRDIRDYSRERTFGSVSIFPDDFTVDAGLTMPDQEQPDLQFTPPLPPLPYGCTDYTSSELCTDEDKKLYNPIDLENVTHANANKGCDMRVSLSAALTVYNRAAYFNVGSAPDAFDGIRSAIYASQSSISIGTPWFIEWATPQKGIIPSVFVQTGLEPWHNWKVSGWKTINGIVYLCGKTWQGMNYGDQGWAYFPRETVNAVMALEGTAAYTIESLLNASVATVDAGLYEKVILALKQFLGLI